jgi:hypothetical protein
MHSLSDLSCKKRNAGWPPAIICLGLGDEVHVRPSYCLILETFLGAVALLGFYLVTSSSLVLFFLAWRLQSLHKDRMQDRKSATNA